MTREEQDLFETLVDNIKANRQHVLAVLDGEESGTAESAEEPTAPEPDVSAADLMGTGTETAADSPGDISAPTEPPEPTGDTDPEPPEPASDSLPPSGEQPSAESVAREETDPATPAEPAADARPPETPAQSDGLRNDGGQLTPADTSGEPTAVERRMVRIIDDVGTFVGSDDRDYDLERNDIVTLPESNATLLIERDAAEQL
jgi:DNA replication factor GINS